MPHADNAEDDDDPTFITSIAALLLFQPVLDDPVGYIGGDGNDNRIYLGAFLELLLVVG